MRCVNEAILVGWVANDPILKETKNGQDLLVFNFGTERFWKTSDGESRSQVQYHKMAAWWNLAQVGNKILKKGSKAYVRGYLHNRRIKIDGEEKPRILTEVVIDDLVVLDNKKTSQEREETEKTSDDDTADINEKGENSED